MVKAMATLNVSWLIPSTSLSEKTSSLPDSPRISRSSSCAFFRGQSEITICLALGNGSGIRLGFPKSALNESRAMKLRGGECLGHH
jgi:hypothetical protein